MGVLMMSHHRRHYLEVNEKGDPEELPPALESIEPVFEKNDLMYLSLIKPLLSPIGQKSVAVFIDAGDPEQKGSQPDLLGLISQLNLKGENNPLKELLPILLSGMAGENKGGVNPVLLNTLMTMLSNRPENKQEN